MTPELKPLRGSLETILDSISPLGPHDIPERKKFGLFDPEASVPACKKGTTIRVGAPEDTKSSSGRIRTSRVEVVNRQDYV